MAYINPRIAALIDGILGQKPSPQGSLKDALIAAAKKNIPRETTVLSPADEYRFSVWARANGINNPDDPNQFYDYRGAFKDRIESQISSVDNAPHWPDTYKRHGHPTFSQESKYSAGKGDGGTWGGSDGETFIAPVRADSIAMLRRLMAGKK